MSIEQWENFWLDYADNCADMVESWMALWSL